MAYLVVPDAAKSLFEYMPFLEGQYFAIMREPESYDIHDGRNGGNYVCTIARGLVESVPAGGMVFAPSLPHTALVSSVLFSSRTESTVAAHTNDDDCRCVRCGGERKRAVLDAVRLAANQRRRRKR